MKRLLVVHYAGDYREADRLRRAEAREIYYGHGYVLDQLERLQHHGAVGILCCLAPAYEDCLPSGVTVMGADTNPDRDAAPVIRLIERFAPTHVLIHGPMPALIRWALRQDFAMGVVMADSFANPFYRWWRFRTLPALLRHPRVTLIANHGANAARAVVAIGVPGDRVLAWDFPHLRTPDLFPAKAAPGPAPCQLLYVGSISAKKGVGDLLRAIALLDGRQDVRLRVAGGGQVERFERLAAKLGLSDRVTFLGLVPNGDIPAMMHAADAVVVPSRHSFPEGLPLTLYEALASRTPVIASDHPMFAGHLTDGDSAIVFPASRPRALAAAIDRLLADPALYARISQGAPAAWARMQNPVKWGDMIDHWMADTALDRQWIVDHSVAALAAARD